MTRYFSAIKRVPGWELIGETGVVFAFDAHRNGLQVRWTVDDLLTGLPLTLACQNRAQQTPNGETVVGQVDRRLPIPNRLALDRRWRDGVAIGPGRRYRSQSQRDSIHENKAQESGRSGMVISMDNAWSTPRLSVVIPCYNEEDSIDQLMLRLVPICENQFSNDYEIVFVNDGSTDRTWDHISNFVDLSPRVVGLDLSRNHGQQLALSAGLEMCRGELIFIIDADLQDPPELLGPMVEMLQKGGHDVVYGQRVSRAGETAFKKMSASLFYRLLDRLTDVSIPMNTGDFRLMTRRVVDQLVAMPERIRFVRGMVGWVGFSQTPFPYERDARFAGKTKWPVGKMIALALDAVTGFSTLPLRFASHLGMILGFLGLGALIWVAASYFYFGTVAGWTSLAGLILIIGSVQMMMLGVFGEYLGRLYMESKQRPLYIVREIRGHRTSKQEDIAGAAQEFRETPHAIVHREFG